MPDNPTTSSPVTRSAEVEQLIKRLKDDADTGHFHQESALLDYIAQLEAHPQPQSDEDTAYEVATAISNLIESAEGAHVFADWLPVIQAALSRQAPVPTSAAVEVAREIANLTFPHAGSSAPKHDRLVEKAVAIIQQYGDATRAEAIGDVCHDLPGIMLSSSRGKYENWTPEDFKRGYELVMGQRNALEEIIIQQFRQLVAHSLCPETFEKFDAVLQELCETRGMPALTQPPAADGKLEALRSVVVKIDTLDDHLKDVSRIPLVLDIRAELGRIKSIVQTASGGGE